MPLTQIIFNNIFVYKGVLFECYFCNIKQSRVKDIESNKKIVNIFRENKITNKRILCLLNILHFIGIDINNNQADIRSLHKPALSTTKR